jgi:hypothetical protein
MTDTITEEPDIPDSDDVPEDEAAEEDEAADDDPHGHAHTAGYPAHRHRDGGVEYDYSQVHQAGGLELFPPERHDSDSAQADAIEQEQAIFDLESLISGFADTARSLGYEVQVTPHGGSPAGRILSVHKESRDISVSVVYDA